MRDAQQPQVSSDGFREIQDSIYREKVLRARSLASAWSHPLIAGLAILLSLSGLSRLMASEPGVERHDPRLDQIVSADAAIAVLGQNYSWAEGPVWDAETQRLLFSSVPKNRVFAWSTDNGVSGALEPSGHTGFGEPPNPKEDGSNGLAIDGKGQLLLCQHGDRRVARLEKDGTFTTLASHFEGKRLNSPNDLAIGPSGAIYFTDPRFGLPKGKQSPLKELEFTGVYRIDPDGTLHLLLDDLLPNGIAFTPDGKGCYVTDKRRLMRYRVNAAGDLVDGTLFATLPEEGGWDGLAIDSAGNVFACNWAGGVFVFAPDGSHLGTIRTGGRTSNCCFGGADGQTLFITAGDELMAIPVLVGNPSF